MDGWYSARERAYSRKRASHPSAHGPSWTHSTLTPPHLRDAGAGDDVVRGVPHLPWHDGQVKWLEVEVIGHVAASVVAVQHQARLGVAWGGGAFGVAGLAFATSYPARSLPRDLHQPHYDHTDSNPVSPFMKYTTLYTHNQTT